MNNSLLLKEAIVYLENNEFIKAAEIFKKANAMYQVGFCNLLAGNELETEKLWYSHCNPSPAVEWGKCLLDFIHLRQYPRIPSFLQIRNFLEADIGYLIKANKTHYAENIIKNSDILMSVNLESCKLIGRVLLNFSFYNLAKKYLLQSTQAYNKDPETYYYLAQFYFYTNDYKESIRNLNKSIDLNSYYLPAKIFMEKVKAKAYPN